jgi:hypothetical protein
MSKILELDHWKRFCEDVSDHIFGKTIYKVDRLVLNTKLDEVIANVNMFCASIVLIFGVCQYDS